MLLKRFGAIFMVMMMELSILGIAGGLALAEENASIQFDVSDHLDFGNAFSMTLPGSMTIAGFEDDHAILGYHETSGQAFAMRRITPKTPLSLLDLENICQGILEDVSCHAAGDLIYLTGHDTEYNTDLCIFEDPETGEVIVFGLIGTSQDMPAAQYFQTLQTD